MACRCAQKLLHASSFLLLTVSSLLAIATHATPPSPVRIAVYWGRNGADSTLEETCRTGLYAYVNLAYLAEFGGGMTPVLDLGKNCIRPREDAPL